MPQATTLLRQFLQAADFATFRHVTVHVDGGRETCVWAQGSAQLEEFFAQVESSGQQCGGIEAILDLTLHWIAPDGIMGSVTLPKAGLLWQTIDSHFRLRSTLTVWPNVFTDETYLYALNQRGTFDRWLVDFVPAAGSNRAQMRRMLQAWEARTGGHVTEWESELVEGVERYGFADDATVIEEL